MELVLPGYDLQSSIPTRTLGDLCTSQYEASSSSVSLEGLPLTLDRAMEDDLTDGTASSQAIHRPTYIHLPPRSSFSIPVSTLTNRPNGGTESSSHTNLPGQLNICLRVLVVDDDHLTRTLMKRMLTRMGCRVTTAENGDIALELILAEQGLTPSSLTSARNGPILEQAHPAHPPPPLSDDEGRYAVIFLDNQMPVMSGLKTVARLRELGRRDFVVGVTGERAFTRQKKFSHQFA